MRELSKGKKCKQLRKYRVVCGRGQLEQKDGDWSTPSEKERLGRDFVDIEELTNRFLGGKSWKNFVGLVRTLAFSRSEK